MYTHDFELVFLGKTINGQIVFNSGHTPCVCIAEGLEMNVPELAAFHAVIDALTTLYKTSGGFVKFEVTPKE